MWLRTETNPSFNAKKKKKKSQRLVGNLFDSEQPLRAGLEADNALIFEEINRELETHLARESGSYQDSTDGVFDLLSSISDSIQE